MPQPLHPGQPVPGARGARPAGRRRPGQRSVQATTTVLAAARGGARPRHAGRRPADRPAAAGRDRPCPPAERTRADHGRADLGAEHDRGRRAVPGDPGADGPGRRGHLHLPPPRGVPGDRRRRGGPARRSAGRHRVRRPRSTSAGWSSTWSAATRARCFPSATPASGRSCSPSQRLQVADPSNPHRLAVDGIDLEIRAGEIVGVYGLMASGRTELLEAIAGRLPVASGSVTFAGRRAAERVGARPDPPRHRAGPRGPAARRAGPDDVGRPEPLAQLADELRAARPDHARAASAAPSSEMITDVTVKTAGQSAPHRLAQRRQPAEGRHRQGAADPARRCCCSTSPPAASTSAPRPTSSP